MPYTQASLSQGKPRMLLVYYGKYLATHYSKVIYGCHGPFWNPLAMLPSFQKNTPSPQPQKTIKIYKARLSKTRSIP
jgi:hypothetical protein